MKRMLTIILQALRGMAHVEKNKDISNTVLLAGVPRSGSTWISNIINHNTEYRYIFEPFFPKYVKPFRTLKYRPYLPPHDSSPELFALFERILQGRIRHFWTDRFNKKVFCSKRLIKEVRINLLLKWLKTNFPDLRVVLLLRHPFAVAHSLVTLSWPSHLDAYLTQPRLVADFLRPFEKELKQCQGDFEKHVCAWCIQNYVPLMQFKDHDHSDLYIAFYEKFCINPIAETKALFKWLDQDCSTIVGSNLKKTSETSKVVLDSVSGEDLVLKWKKFVPVNDIERGLDWMQFFGLDHIYGVDPLPLCQGRSPKDFA